MIWLTWVSKYLIVFLYCWYLVLEKKDVYLSVNVSGQGILGAYHIIIFSVQFNTRGIKHFVRISSFFISPTHNIYTFQIIPTINKCKLCRYINFFSFTNIRMQNSAMIKSTQLRHLVQKTRNLPWCILRRTKILWPMTLAKFYWRNYAT